MSEQLVLLNPGPVTLSPAVREALTQPDMCHREPEFFDLQDRLLEQLAAVYPSPEHSAVLLTGSGTLAVEAMLSSLVPADAKVLVVVNGVYGERMLEMCRVHGIEHTSVDFGWVDTIDADRLNEALAGGGISHVAVVHHETTTGMLNDLSAVADVAHRHGVRLLVDSVSSFGAEAIDLTGWDVDACTFVANKCLHGAPGVCGVVARDDAFARSAARTVYMDLGRYRSAQSKRSTPFTQAIPAMYALDVALRELVDGGGQPGRLDLYRARMKVVRDAAIAAKAELLLTHDQLTSCLTAFKLPAGISYEALHDHLKAEGFVIYAGQGDLAGSIFRVAVMGEIPDGEIERFASLMHDFLCAP